jgi:hypothetical protein
MNEWSDDEDEVEQAELLQPNRDLPVSSEEEDEDYDMEEIRNLTLKKQTNMWNEIVKQEPNKSNVIKKPIQVKNVYTEPKKYEKRKFNPRLPPPNKNKYNNNFKFNENDFPSL